MSPISVRTDPDTKKMFLLLPKSPKPSSAAGASAGPSSPSKRKLTTPPKSTSPTKTPRTLDGTPRRLITGEHEVFGTEEEDGLVLTPGKAKGTRIALGSPSKSPLLARLGDTPKDKALRSIVDEDDDSYITPRSVRQRPKGVPLPPLATQKAAAVFRGASIPSSSSATSISQRQHKDLFHTGPFSSLAAVSSSQSEVESETDRAADEADLPEPKHALSTQLPLPSFYSSLMTLHVALEHALVVHLATAGCASATLESSVQTSSDSDSESNAAFGARRKATKTVRLPNLISYTALRPLVERSGGRRLGPTELRRLANVWLDFQRQSSDAVDEVRGLGFIIGKTRSIDTRTGRRALDWGIGIELEIKRAVREKTPPTQIGFGGVEVQSSPLLASADNFDDTVRGTAKMPARSTTPPPAGGERVAASARTQLMSPLLGSPRRKVGAESPTPSSPKVRSSLGAAKAREGMSVVAMWNNGLETRKAEVARRLRERCARFHQLWLDENGISVPAPKQAHEPSTPSRKLAGAAGAESDSEDVPGPPREVVMGAGGLLTPSATRSGGRRVGKRTFHLDPSELDSHTLSDDDDDDAVLGLEALQGGKQSMLAEVSHSVVRTSKSMPNLAAAAVPPEGADLVAWHVEFPLDDARVVKPVPLAALPSLSAPLATPHRNKEIGLGISDPTTPRKAIKYTAAPELASEAAPSTAGMSLRERIQAKEQLRRTASLPALASGSMTPMQALSQRALVSRLPELCSILFMLFSNGTTLSSTGITRSPTIPMQDLLAKLSKSTKITLSPRECRAAIDLLASIAPGFLVVLNPSDTAAAGTKEYVRLGTNPDTNALWRLNDLRARIASQLNAHK